MADLLRHQCAPFDIRREKKTRVGSEEEMPVKQKQNWELFTRGQRVNATQHAVERLKLTEQKAIRAGTVTGFSRDGKGVWVSWDGQAKSTRECWHVDFLVAQRK